MRHSHPISRLRDGSINRDRAILDALHLQELGFIPGKVPVRLLESLWHVTQPQVSRRMAAVAELGLYYVKSAHGAYVVVQLTHQRNQEAAREQREQEELNSWAARRERYEAIRRQLQPTYRATS
jgi:hypothetical protein